MDTFLQHSFLCHYGIKGMKWGVRRYQNLDGSLTNLGMLRYTKQKVNEQARKQFGTVGSGLNTFRKAAKAREQVMTDGFKNLTKTANPVYKQIGLVGYHATALESAFEDSTKRIAKEALSNHPNPVVSNAYNKIDELAEETELNDMKNMSPSELNQLKDRYINTKKRYEEQLSDVKQRPVSNKSDGQRKQIDIKDLEDRIKECTNRINKINNALKTANERTKNNTAVRNLQNKPASIQNDKGIANRNRLINEAEHNTPQKYSITKQAVKDVQKSDLVNNPTFAIAPLGPNSYKEHVWEPLKKKVWGERKKKTKNKGR